MIQRLCLVLLPACMLAACGGGDGETSSYNPNTPPKIADQQPPVSEPKPPDYSQPPSGTSTSTPGGGPGGGHCETVCRKLVDGNCNLEGDADCTAACQEIQTQDCPTELLDLIDCAYGLGYCPNEINNDNAQQIATSCLAQATAYANCADTNGSDNNNNDGL